MEREGEDWVWVSTGVAVSFFLNLLCVCVANWYGAGCPSMVDEEISIYLGKASLSLATLTRLCCGYESIVHLFLILDLIWTTDAMWST